MIKTKIFAMYLPQYHEIKENSLFWGEGFTDWVSVKNSKPLFEGHKQPRVPLNENYYDLSRMENIKWQCDLAKKYGIDGFAIYHYWFNEKDNLLTRPSEIILENTDINIKYFFAWDNTSWVRTWSRIRGNDWFPSGDKIIGKEKNGKEVLVQYSLGDKIHWKKHYDYLSHFFRDDRYEKRENKPVFMILNPDDGILEMEEYWNQLAVQDGFGGIHVIYRWDPIHLKSKAMIANKPKYIYEPSISGWGDLGHRIRERLLREFGKDKLKKYNYDGIWEKIIKYAEKNAQKTMSYCAFVDYDDTPRRGAKGRIVLGGTPEKFQSYFAQLLKLSLEQKKEYLFITAWNEWGEGAYLEPDVERKYEYLKAIREAKRLIEE